MGCHAKWVLWVMQCVSTVKSSVVVNGEARVRVIPGHGLRQGDPLSTKMFYPE